MSFAARPIGLVKGGFVFVDVITSDVTNYNLRARAVAAGWDQVVPLVATTTVNSGIVLSADSTGQYAFDTGVTFPAGTTLALINNGFVIGMGGAGGAEGTAGSNGGPALRAQYAIGIDAAGGVIGGGGGGGGGSNRGGGGGGRSGRTDAAGGVGVPTGESGTFSSGGSGGGGGGAGGTTGPGAAGGVIGGGGGGGWGASGGTAGYYAGGTGGAAVVGNSYITWINTGTRYGSIT